MNMALLEISQVSAGYGEVQVLWDVNVKLEEGKLTSLIGGNGVGKTTLLRAVMGLIRAWEGHIRFDGSDIVRSPAFKKADMGLVLVPEGRQLFATMTVEENLEMGATNKRARANMATNLDKVYELFPRLKERRRQVSGTMSGGEQQMLAVARGLMAEPRILMLDELSLGLAPVLVIDLFGTLGKLQEEGLTMLLVEQNVHMALAVSDYAYVLAEGRVTLEGPAKEVSQDPAVRTAYLGI
jgi:branched-chain amino acid transport system ATP-binding protein